MAELIDSKNVIRKDGFYKDYNLFAVNFSNPDGTLPDGEDRVYIIFTAFTPCEVVWASEIHNASGASSVKLLRNNTDEIVEFSLTTSGGTVNEKEKTELSNTLLKRGDYIQVSPTGAISRTQNSHIEIYLKPIGKGDYN